MLPRKVPFVDYRPLPRSNGGSRPNASDIRYFRVKLRAAANPASSSSPIASRRHVHSMSLFLLAAYRSNRSWHWRITFDCVRRWAAVIPWDSYALRISVATLQLTVSQLFLHTIIRMHAITLVVTHQGATCIRA